MLAATATIFDPLTLACGLTLPNRLAKAAMEENLAAPGQVPDERLWALYRTWSRGGSGMLITGNVMVDGRALTGPAGVVLEATTGLAPFREWAESAKSGGSIALMQISHPGRQVFAGMGMTSWAPSAVSLDLGKFSKMFEMPRAMTHAEVLETIARFTATAAAAERAGFDGVEIHAAHGYLVSQFLSPLSNRRDDEWGGALENRARLLLEIVKGIRAVVAPSFAVAVKLNSADFQRGGFDADDARKVIGMLGGLGVDFVELSGGTYESPAMQGRTTEARTLAREAYFLEFAVELLSAARMPIMVTGGIRTRRTAEAVVASGVAIVGIATGLALTPDLPDRWRESEHVAPAPPQLKTKEKGIQSLAMQAFIGRQIRRTSAGGAVKMSDTALVSLVLNQLRRFRMTRRYKAWLRSRAS